MANAFYGLGKKKILDADIDMLVDTIKAALVSSEYTVNLATHEFYSDLTFAKTISKVAVTSNVVTITTSAAHGLVAGMTGTIAATTNTAVNGAFTVVSAPTTTTFTYAKTTTDIVEVADTGTVTAAALLLAAVTMANPTTTLGVYDADDVVFEDVPAGGSAKYVVLYRDTGDTAISPLIAYFDTISNFPATTNGGDITIQWSSGASKIFAL